MSQFKLARRQLLAAVHLMLPFQDHGLSHLLPASRTVHPKSVLAVNGRETNFAYTGTTHLSGKGSQHVFDFGQDVGGTDYLGVYSIRARRYKPSFLRSKALDRRTI